MKWNDSTYLIPEDKEEVIIRFNGAYHVATYRASKSAFMTSDKKEVEAGQQIFWMPLTPPMEEQKSKSV